MKIFISYKFRGTNKKTLRKRLKLISSILEKVGNQTFVFYRDEENWQEMQFPPGEVIKKAFKKIKWCDVVVCLLDHQEQSEGMLLEIGFAKALNKKVILLISQELFFPTLEAISDQVIKFKNEEDFLQAITKVK